MLQALLKLFYLDSKQTQEAQTAYFAGGKTNETWSKSTIQPITARKIIFQPIGMLGHGMVTARHEPYRNY